MNQSPYVYVVNIGDQGPAIFTWPNVARKYIRDTFTTDGELHLPPRDRVRLTRHKVNPRAGAAVVTDYLSVEVFLSAS